MVRKQEIMENKAENYLKTIEEAKNLFEALDYPPSRIRAILIQTFSDYFKGKIKEEILITVGSILHQLQIGTWDYDSDIMSVTCSLDDFWFEGNLKAYEKKKREDLYKEWYESLSKNQTISISLPITLIKKLETKHKMIQEFVKKIFLEYFSR